MSNNHHKDPLNHGVEGDEAMVKDGIVDKICGTVGKIPFADKAIAAYCCAVDPTTPIRVKTILIAALTYFIMPLDLVPDFIAGLGYGDDAAVFWAAWNSVSGHVKEEHIADAKRILTKITGKNAA